ncbi:MAG TPA: helix-turn-helix transcriptional regulator [Solirubrobacterales bacterium]|nr:helix-turn-helix transcriptional regulator [Solirubrobacterales bacterium]
MADPELQAEAFGRRFGQNMARLREAAGLTQDELSYLAGLHRTEISKLERGLHVPRADTVVKLCGCLDAGLDELLEGLVWTPPPQPKRGSFAVDESR